MRDRVDGGQMGRGEGACAGAVGDSVETCC